MLLQAAAAAVDAVVKGAVPVTDPGQAITFESYVHQAGVAAVSVWVIQVLKNSKWCTFISANSDSYTKAVAWLTALFSAFAIQFSVTGSSAVGWHGTFDIPNAHVLWDDCIRLLGSKGMQTAIYEYYFHRPIEVTPVTPAPIDVKGKPISNV